ncbi:MAG: universal stress protein [Ilumatobacter sp.]
MSALTRRWTVGHDGSGGASHAARWALEQATGRDVDVVVVRGWDIPALDFPFPSEAMEDFVPPAVSGDIGEIEASAAERGVSLGSSVVRGAAVNVLLDEAVDSSLVVVGSRGMGGFRRLLLGSVSSQCAAHATVPTVVVPATAPQRAVRRIVVGLDGSDRSRRALAWAMEFAPEGCEMLVVGAWMPSKSGFVAVAQHYSDEHRQARDRFDEILDEVEADPDGVPFERRFVFADPAATLLEEAESSDLVVVGQRGHSGVSAAILGSVSMQVLHRSPVAVAVIPDGS